MSIRTSLGLLAQRIERGQHRRLQDELPHWHVRGGVVINDQGQAETGLWVQLPASTTVTEAAKATLLNQWQGLLRAVVGEGQRIRLCARVGRADPSVLQNYQAEATSDDPVSTFATTSRVQHLQEHIQEGYLVERQVFISCTFGRKLKKHVGLTTAEIGALMGQARVLRDQLGTLRVGGWELKPMSSRETYALMHAYYNPDENGIEPPEPPEGWDTYPAALMRQAGNLRPLTLKASLGRSSLNNTQPKQLRLGQTYVSILNLFAHPDAIPRYTGEVLESALLDRGDCWLVMDFAHQPQQAAVAALKFQANLADALLKFTASSGKRVDSQAMGSLTAAAGLEEHLQKSGDHLYSASVSLILLSPDPELLKERVRGALSDLNAIPGRPFVDIQDGLLDTFINCGPFTCRSNAKAVMLHSGNCANLMVKTGPYRGGEKASSVFLNRHWELTRFSLSDPRAQGGALAIVGPKGSGKSFAAQRLLMDELRSAETEVFTLDVKPTYEPLNRLYNGDAKAYVKLSFDSEQGLNPFQLDPEQLKPDETQLQFQSEVVYRMAGLAGDHPEEAAYKSLIGRAVLKAFAHNTVSQRQPDLSYREVARTTTLGDVDAMLEALLRDPELIETEGGRIRDLRVRLEYYVKGVGAKLFNRPVALEIPNRPLVSFDLGGLQANPALTRIAILVLNYVIWQKVKNIRKNTIVHMDEAWMLLQDPDGLRMIQSLQRTGRSYRGIPSLVVHELDDLAQPGILSNLDNLLLFRCDIEKANRFILDHLKLSPEIAELVGTLRFEQGRFTEALLLCKRGGNDGQWEAGVVRITQSPFEYWLFTQHGPDIVRRDEAVRRSGGDLWEALRELAG